MTWAPNTLPVILVRITIIGGSPKVFHQGDRISIPWFCCLSPRNSDFVGIITYRSLQYFWWTSISTVSLRWATGDFVGFEPMWLIPYRKNKLGWFYFITIMPSSHKPPSFVGCITLQRRANYFSFFFLSGLGIIFGFLLLCFSCFSCFSAFLLFLLFLLLCFSAFLLFCFSCFSPFLFFCFSASPASLLLLLLCFSAFLLFCFSCFFASLLFLLLLLLCFSAFPASLPFCCFAFVRFLFLCFSAFLLLCFFFALPALNTWFSCKMHFAQYLHPWVSHDQPSLEN